MRARLALLALLALAVPPGAATAAPRPDRVLDEVAAPMGVGIDGSVVAYARGVGTGRVEVVVRHGDRAALRLAAGRGSGPMDVGRDRSGHRVVVFERCDRRCELVAHRVAGRSSRVVVRDVRAIDVSVGAGRVFWTDGVRVRSRALDGGPVRREAVAGRMRPTSLDTDGTTLAVGGPIPFDYGNGATGVSVTRVGSGRARLRARRQYGEEYVVLRDPVVTPDGVTTLLDVSAPGIARSFADLSAGRRGFAERTTGAMKVVDWDAAGGRAVFVEAPTFAGCGIGELYGERRIADAPCRIVSADLRGARLLPPRLTFTAGGASLLRTELEDGTVRGRRPVPGVAVELRRGAEVVGRLVTDDQGHVALPPVDFRAPLTVVALGEPLSYAFYG